MPRVFSEQDIEVHECVFGSFFSKAKINLRFPCSFFLEWKSVSGNILAISSNKYKAKNGIVEFNESMSFKTELLWDRKERGYLKKDSLLKVNLVSASRPDQVKLVGQVNIDLGQVANSASKEIQCCQRLSYCSVDA